MLENPLEYSPLPRDLDMLSPGSVYLVPDDSDARILLTHCTGLNCSRNTASGIELGVISPDNYLSIPFTAKAGTFVRAVEPTEGSCRCGECNRHCVTLGPNDADNVYNIKYEPPADNSPQYLSHLGKTPIGSIIKFPKLIYGKQVIGDNLGVYTDPLSADIKYRTGLSTLGFTVSPIKEERSMGSYTYVLPSNTTVQILTIPEGTQIWATCWEIKGPDGHSKNIRRAINTFVDKMLGR
ncbi:hypothetical protein KC675_04885 [Candidatus Dojkabacteria bacterium]|uniref:Uncharacterized protein n=1 Tax=Candidatus Dojkabacteria bacterium TaxID=2099670 RepID=A0A955IA50_9BACT|nr:hypothetical protein [Candidatus Dojkabacteria bacterium]